MNDRGWNSRRRQRQRTHLTCFLFDWKQLDRQCFQIRKDEGSTGLRSQLGTIFFYRVCWYSQTWFINLQLCVLTFGHGFSFFFFFYFLGWTEQRHVQRFISLIRGKGALNTGLKEKLIFCVIMQSIRMRGIYHTYTNTTLLQRAAKKRINWNEIWSHGKYEIISISQTGDAETSRIPLFFFIARLNNVLWQQQELKLSNGGIRSWQCWCFYL